MKNKNSTWRKYEETGKEKRKLFQLKRRLSESIKLINGLVKDDPKKELDGFEIDLMRCRMKIILSINALDNAVDKRYPGINLESYK